MQTEIDSIKGGDFVVSGKMGVGLADVEEEQKEDEKSDGHISISDE